MQKYITPVWQDLPNSALRNRAGESKRVYLSTGGLTRLCEKFLGIRTCFGGIPCSGAVLGGYLLISFHNVYPNLAGYFTKAHSLVHGIAHS